VLVGRGRVRSEEGARTRVQEVQVVEQREQFEQ